MEFGDCRFENSEVATIDFRGYFSAVGQRLTIS